MTQLRNALVAAFLVLLPFQDIGLKNSSLGVLGTSLSVLPLVCLVALSFLVWLYGRQWQISWTVLGAIAYLLVLNLVTLLRFGTAAMGVNLIAKSVTLAVITFLWAFSIFGIDYLALPNFARYLQAVFVIVLLGIAFGDLNLGHLGFLVNNSFLHGTDNSDRRWRSLASEASLFAPLMINVGLVAAHYAKKTPTKVTIGLMSVVALIVSGSKGAIVALTLTCVILAMAGGLRVKTLLKASLLAIPLLIFASNRFTQLSSTELLEATTTAATRSTMALWALRLIISNPLGLGFGGFYAALGQSIPATIDQVYRLSPIPLNFSEVEQYAVSAENASTKIFVLNYALFCGLPVVAGLIFTVWKRMRVLNIRQHFLLIASVCYSVLALSSSVDPPTTYSLFFVFGVALNEAARVEHKSLQSNSFAKGERLAHNDT